LGHCVQNKKLSGPSKQSGPYKRSPGWSSLALAGAPCCWLTWRREAVAALGLDRARLCRRSSVVRRLSRSSAVSALGCGWRSAVAELSLEEARRSSVIRRPPFVICRGARPWRSCPSRKRQRRPSQWPWRRSSAAVVEPTLAVAVAALVLEEVAALAGVKEAGAGHRRGGGK
jgi:hypothetical protein